ncbi:MAG: septum formation initiator family protein [Phascolarctobacterium sp.]|nr:septum formation initiator family protein [Phascolarctobacterium sp.]
MLARKYEYDPEYEYGYTWEDQQRHREAEEALKREERRKLYRKQQRKQALVLVGTVLAIYALCVVRSLAMYDAGQTLVKLRAQEESLRTTNSALRIEVEQLKGPERIRGLASQMLGMSVARENFYVNQVGAKKGSAAVAMAKN